jgi:hypothetical protein
LWSLAALNNGLVADLRCSAASDQFLVLRKARTAI